MQYRQLSRPAVLIGVAAATLAAMAALNAAAARRAERRHPPRGRFVEVDGVPLHYLERGEGPPVVLLHGNIVTAEDFAASGLIDRLARRHRVIAFDRPGMGHSGRARGRRWTPAEQADVLRRAWRALGAERPVVLGHSLGAVVAAALALDHPDALGGLVLLSGYYFPTARADVALTAPAALPVLGDLLRHTVSPLTGRALLPAAIRAMFHPCPVPESFEATFSRGLAVRPGQLRASAEDAAFMIAAAAAQRDRYGSLRLPVVIMAGSADKVVDVARQSERLHRAIAGSELRLVPDVGHMIHYAAPDAVVRAVERVSGDVPVF